MIIKVKLKDLKEMEGNPRKITKEEMNKLKENIKEFGLVVPLVLNKDLTIIGGHQRYQALKELGYKEADAIILDLDEDKAKVLNLSLNRVQGNWDYEKLVEFIKDIDEMDLSGFNEQELKEITTNYDYNDLTKELESLKDEEAKTIKWTAKFSDSKQFEKVAETIRKLKTKHKLSNFKSEYSNAKVVEILCDEYGNGDVLEKLCDNYEKKKGKKKEL